MDPAEVPVAQRLVGVAQCLDVVGGGVELEAFGSTRGSGRTGGTVPVVGPVVGAVDGAVCFCDGEGTAHDDSQPDQCMMWRGVTLHPRCQ